MMPDRIQMSRQHPWRAEHPDAVIVARPFSWGNQFPVGLFGQERAVELYRQWLEENPNLIEMARRELRGKDLACWCPMEDAVGNRVPCHADVLLEVANE